MSSMRILLCILLLAVLLITPVLGFSSDILDIDVQEEGGAGVSFTYSLTWYERFAVFLQIADPAQEFRNAIEGLTGQPVTIQEVSGDSVMFSVDRFASVYNEEGARIFITPTLRFPEAGTALQQYWFAPLVQADFSPAVTTIRFPDGSAEVWTNAETIPTVIHREPRYITAPLVC
ncbi:MAG: hypothetical protein LUO93_02910 [Methanomicrobiales archaeon]|nr:hypothetical protein [Methanomicrobiales archaeon]